MPRRRATAGSTRTSSTSTNATWAPSTYYYRQIFGCFFRDQHGIDALDKVGVDNVTFETDYPHTDSTWPDTKAVATELMRDVPTDAVEKIMRGNARRMLSL
jgi:predicted TIM-barrel fold metal-dependent hydrolase